MRAECSTCRRRAAHCSRLDEAPCREASPPFPAYLLARSHLCLATGDGMVGSNRRYSGKAVTRTSVISPTAIDAMLNELATSLAWRLGRTIYVAFAGRT